jgi:hypothetical protein
MEVNARRILHTILFLLSLEHLLEYEGVIMPLSYAKRKLELWRRRNALDAKIDEIIKRRLGKFRKGSISSEEFERATREERNLARLNERIIGIENKKRERLV